MTISKKLALTAIILIGSAGIVHATSMIGFDYKLLTTLIEKSKKAVDAVTKSLNATKATCTDAKAFAKNLYNQQKDALKLIKAELKQAYKTAKLENKPNWFADKQLYKAYKKLVYKNWKKTRLFPSV
jgi:hypothetical protein